MHVVCILTYLSGHIGLKDRKNYCTKNAFYIQNYSNNQNARNVNIFDKFN